MRVGLADQLGHARHTTIAQDPPFYAIVARDQHRIHFRCAEPPAPNPDKYADEFLDAYVFVGDADALFAE